MDLEFLDGEKSPSEAAQPEPKAPEAAPAEAAAETPEQKESRERDERGRFKAKEEAAAPVAPTPAPVPETIAAPTPASTPEGYVPLAALLAERDKRTALEAQMPKPQAAPSPSIGPAPDMFEDPEGYRAWNQQQIANVQLNISEEMTRDKFGDELVDAAKAWATEQFQSRPGFAQEVLSQRNPYGYAVKAYQKAQSLSQLGDDPEEIKAFLAWKQAQSAQPAAPVAQPPPERPPQSIAAAPSAGGLQHTAVGPGVAFDDTIRK